jgi:hypothetical protein
METTKLDNLLAATKSFYQQYLENGIDTLIECLKVPEYLNLLEKLNEMTLEDLSKSIQDLVENLPQNEMASVTLYSSDNIAVGLLILDAGTEYPIHDHPGITVSTKILRGEMQQLSFDMKELAKQFELPHLRCPRGECTMMEEEKSTSTTSVTVDAKLASIFTLAQGDLVNLTPVSQNLHMFKAVSRTVLLKVLTPNYDSNLRFCNFYDWTLDTKEIPEIGSSVTLNYLTTPVMLPIKFYALSDDGEMKRL